MAKQMKKGPAGEAGRIPSPQQDYQFQILNLAEMRAVSSLRRTVLVDQNGKAHDLAGLPLDTYLAFLEFEETQRTMAAEEASDSMTAGRQRALLDRMRSLILSVLPDFPVAGLFLHELGMVAQAIQAAVLPAGMERDGGGQGNLT